MATASDIITYFGVPLAVLGVLPIFYTFINSFFTLRNVKRSLRRCGLEATTRGSFLAGFVEASLPRFTITPLERTEDEFWTEDTRASTLKGGTWTIFHWKRLITGHAMQRVQYSSDLRVPQAEVELEELYEFLLDRGAVPDVKGIHMLRVSGLWTPAGTSLMLSPDSKQTALRMSMPDESDGVLSLALQWKPEWNKRNRSSLPPSWIRLEFPATPSSKVERRSDDDLEKPANNTSTSPFERESPNANTLEAKENRNLYPDPPPPPSYSPSPTSLCFRLTSSSTHPFVQFRSPTYELHHEPLWSAPLPSLDGTRPTTTWLAPLSLALGLSSRCPTTFLTLPKNLHNLSLSSSIPCGVLVLAHLISPNDAPEWESPELPKTNHLEAHERFMSQQRAIARERLLPEAQQQQAARLRQSEELSAMGTRMRKEQQDRAEREERREREAIKSIRMPMDLVKNAALGFLEGEGLVSDAANNSDDATKDYKDPTLTAVERLILGIYNAAVCIDLEENKWAVNACAMLDRWRDWVERGGMTKEDLRAILQDKEAFCWAAVAVGLITKVCGENGADGVGLLNDVRECLRVWKKVRLG
ncbi:MAG: hypothetical protein L6R42_008226 [Xanthoria sp. 1 TBL-2021]|nr:MAG: hypothetical protein L6R42_008226 [Xanthoria sp. 1 TBL-2021]